MSVSVSNLCKTYGQQLVLDNVSFQAMKGQITGFLGPNGAGKSTTMKIAISYIPANSGLVEVAGFNVNTHPLDVKRKVGYLPEHNPLYLDMYVLESLEFTSSVYKLGNARSRIDAVIEQVGLGTERNKKIGQLSKGYRQRVGLAQAIIHEPEVLILDEPLTGLDPNQIVEIRSLIKELGRDKTVIFSTHIMQEVETLCDKVIIINKGKIVADKTLAELKTNNSNTRAIIIEFSRTENIIALQALQGVIEAVILSDNKVKLVHDISIDIRQDIFAWAQQNNNSILSLNTEENTLESIFQKLTA